MYRYPETIKFKKSDVGNYKQQNMVSKVLGKEYDAHDASADIKSLYELLSKLDFSEKDIFPINITLLSQSFTPLIKRIVHLQTSRSSTSTKWTFSKTFDVSFQ